MKQALISPIEPVQTGYRVADIADQAFEVAPPMFWVDCADDVVADQFWFDSTDQTIKPVPVQPIAPAQDQPDVQGAQTL